MSDHADFYPPTPAGVPEDLTRPSGSYRLRVIIVLISLAVFVALYFGLTFGSAYLCYWCFASLREPASTPIANRSQLNSISRAEQQILQTFDDAAKRANAHTIDNQEFLRIVETSVLPGWRAERQRLSQLHGTTAAEKRVLNLYLQSFQRQEESWDLLVRGIRENDRALVDQAKQKMQEADQLARQTQQAANAVQPPPRSDSSPILMIILGIVSGLLCLFLVKGFFKWQRRNEALQTEITEEEQPMLVAFIRRVCRDTGAPFPRHIYLTPDVNAAVFYNESVLSLFLPTSKNLIIGLGLVNCLNLSEFKAVLAHEFGHFSQNSLKLGSYVYRSNRVISDLVYGRDWLDRVVTFASRIDIRISIFVWTFMGILWVVRKGLQYAFKAINFANTALSRQMEFNADLVAVSVTGSDALVNGLCRTNFGADCWMQTLNDITAAADHGIFSRDLFYHQTRTGAYLRALRKDPRFGEPPPLPADPHEKTQVFHPEDTSVPRMWATHPSNFDREMNAKRHYIRSPIDDRSPWGLFESADAVRESMTRKMYELNRKDEALDLKPPEVVQAFIDDEHAEMIYDARYCGLYDNRYLTPGEFEPLLKDAAAFHDPGELGKVRDSLYGDEMKTRMEAHHARNKEFGMLTNLVNGHVELTGKDFSFRGDRRSARDAKKLYDEVQQEINADFKWMEDLDRQAFLVHHAMASRLGDDLKWELEERYRFHLAVQQIHFHLTGEQQQINATLNQIGGSRELSQEQFQYALAVMRQAHQTLKDKLDYAQELRLPAMKNMNAGDALGPFLLSKPLVHPLAAQEQTLDGQWIGQLLGQLAEVIDKTKRIHFKSLGGVLALQQRIAERWHEKQAAMTGAVFTEPEA